MFDKVKSMFKKDDKPASPTASSGGGPKIWSMPPEMQREFEKGVKYNMKLVIRGLRKTGKSSLLARLHGRPFAAAYAPSPEISAATIRFQPRDLPEDHGAKLDMWDVVDVGVKEKSSSSSSTLQVVADATTIDVYRGCNCVIFLVDVMCRESLDYVVREARVVPPTTAILIALNFVDLPKPHVVSERDVDEVCRRMQRVSTPLIFLASQGNPPEKSVSAAATWIPISAATGFGLDLVRAYFEIPFAMLHVETLEAQMKAVYRKVEEHQAWLLSERAVLNFEEREKAKPKPLQAEPSAESPRKAEVPPIFVPVPDQTRQAVAAKTETPTASAAKQIGTQAQQQQAPTSDKPKKAAAKPSPPPSSRDYDESKIANDFFGDMSDDTPPAEDSSSEGDLQPVPPRRTAAAVAGRGSGTSPKQPSPPSADSTPSPKGKAAAPPAQKLPVTPPIPTTVEVTPAAVPQRPPAQPAVRVAEPVFDFAVDDQKGVADDFFGGDDDDDDGNDDAAAVETKAASSAKLQPQLSSSLPPRAATTEPDNHIPSSPPPAKPPKVDDSFFGDEDEEEGPPKVASVVKQPVAARRQSSDDDDPEGQPSHARGPRIATLRGRPQPKPAPKPVAAAAVPVAVDIAALVAQMQSAITAQPPQEEGDEPLADEDGGRERHGKEKKSKKDKLEKKSKKEKSKKSRGGHESDDGGFDEVRE